MESAWNTKQISHKLNATWTGPVTQISQQPNVTQQGLEHKRDITAARCNMESAWNTKQISQHPNVTGTGLEIQNRYITPIHCHRESAWNTRRISQ